MPAIEVGEPAELEDSGERIELSALVEMMQLARQEANRHELSLRSSLRDSLWDWAYARSLLEIFEREGWSLERTY